MMDAKYRERMKAENQRLRAMLDYVALGTFFTKTTYPDGAVKVEAIPPALWHIDSRRCICCGGIGVKHDN